ncbi:MAG TPA: A/G-specific adenine glycosylase [Opitutaceae bacterium]|nr:A/G-specific adenine glycosylase [Opitutaceae bacterium]
MLTEHPADFQRALRKRFLTNQRPLPWRTERSLYRTVVSEFMLQQTQVKTVLPFFAAWMARFPDFPALAAAPEADVLKAWEGLGYYNRARNLHRLAKAVAAMSTPPDDAEGWRELPGVGPYTAAAIASIACGAPAACVDGNVVRVLARLTATRTAFADNGTAVKHFTPLAGALLNRRHPGDHNEALMELGATVCTKTAPACLRCPVAQFCAGFATGDPASLPRIARKATVLREVTRAWCVDRGRLLLHRADGAARRFAGIHELPELSALEIDSGAGKLLLTRSRSITHHRITETIRAVRLTSSARNRIARDESLVWVSLATLESVTLSGPHRRWVKEIMAASSSAGL